MSSNWITPLEMCASGGVLDYDAAADIMGLPQRFVGHPQMGEIPPVARPLLLPPEVKIQGELKQDSFGAPSDLIQNPSWKKWLFGGVILGGITLLTLGKLGKLGKLGEFFSFKSAKGAEACAVGGAGKKTSKFKMPDFSKFGESVKSYGQKILDLVKSPFKRFKK